MDFMEAYKRLEKLCGEILGDDRRVSGYIDEMLKTPQGAYRVRGWNEDLKQLKHYRWVRNQIVHDPSCCEENMCSEGDTQWILDFYARIMDQTDPLALYRKAVQASRNTANDTDPRRYPEQMRVNPRKAGNCLGVFITLLIGVAATITCLVAAVVNWVLI